MMSLWGRSMPSIGYWRIPWGEEMKPTIFRIGTSDLTAIRDASGKVVGCTWNGYRDSCARCNIECPVRGS